MLTGPVAFLGNFSVQRNDPDRTYKRTSDSVIILIREQYSSGSKFLSNSNKKGICTTQQFFLVKLLERLDYFC